MAGSIHFDIYVKVGPRWQFDQKFHQVFREDALDRAKTLDAEPDNDGVRVIRVTSYGPTRAAVETIEWISPGITKIASPAQLKARKKASREAKKNTEVQKPAKAEPTKDRAPLVHKTIDVGKPEKKPARFGILALKCLAILITSAVVSWLMIKPVTLVVNLLIEKGLRLTPDVAAISIFAFVGLLFTLTAVLAARIVFRPNDAQAETEPVADTAEPEAATPPTPKSENGRFIPTGPAPETVNVFDRPDDTRPDPAVSAEPEAPVALVELNADNNTIEPGKQLSDDNRKTMLRFLERCLTELKDDIERLDQYTVFGINLFLGGAVDRLSENLDLTAMQKFVLIRESIGTLGTPAEMIDVFCAKFDEYNAERKYRLMTDTGRRLMDSHLAGETDDFRELSDMMRRWRRSDAAAAQAQGIVVIMFTDLVGSTQMTHDRGDFGAQEIVRSHNAIVRTALAEHHGEEVKHTGDGIMASFANPIGSVGAAIRIQRDLATHNHLNPDNPVNVRIGLNAGDAVREEDDFFGQTVQLAARICDKADSGQILITGSVRDLCKGNAFDMLESGPFELKGIDHPVIAYTVSSAE